MSTFKNNFRIWWQKPRKYEDKLPDRTVTFLELFYDLVYVVIIAQLAHAFSTHLDLHGFLNFVFLFLVVYVAWFNGATYHDSHGNNDIKTRVVTFLQMIGVAAMAVFAHHAIGDSSIGFAWSYAFFLLIITYLWWRTGVHDKAHAVLSVPYSITFLLATGTVVASIFVEEPMRYYLWGISLFIILVVPVLTIVFRRNNENVMAQMKRANLVTHSLVERFGLFIIIVLGEVIVGVVQGLAGHHHFGLEEGLAAALGLGIGIGLWWLYFDLISTRLPYKSMGSSAAWGYLHLPLTIGIVTIGATILYIIEHSGEAMNWNSKLFLIGGVITAYLSIVLLSLTLDVSETMQKVHQVARRIILVVIMLTLGLIFIELPTIPLLAIILLLMLVPIYFGLKVWIKHNKDRILASQIDSKG